MSRLILPSLMAFGLLGACNGETQSPAEPQAPSGIEELATEDTASPAPAAPQDMNEDQDGSLAGDAAEVTISLPNDIDAYDEELQTLLRERASEGTEDFRQMAEEDRVSMRADDIPFRGYTLDVSWEDVGPQTGPVQSFLETTWKYTGGAHGNTGFDVLNWDKNMRAPIRFEDVFEDSDAAIALLAPALETALIEAKRERLQGYEFDEEDMLNDWIRPALGSEVEAYRNFTFAPSTEEGKSAGLTYHYGPYEVGSYAEGGYSATVPGEAFRAALSEDYAGLFQGEMVPQEVDEDAEDMD